MKIQDGTGQGYIARVDKNNRLKTESETSDLAVVSNKAGEAYIISSGRMSLGAGVETNSLYIENTSPDRDLVADEFHINHNGGNTNADKLLDIKIYVGALEPTANNTLVTPGAANTSSTITAPVKQYSWNGVGSGMTTAFQGINIGSTFYERGFTANNLPSKFIVGPGQKILITMEMAEAGKAGFTAYIHLRKED